MEKDTIGCSRCTNATTDSASYGPTLASTIMDSITIPLRLLYTFAIQTVTSHSAPISTTSTQPEKTCYLDQSTTQAVAASSPVSNTTRAIIASKGRPNTSASQHDSNLYLACDRDAQTRYRRTSSVATSIVPSMRGYQGPSRRKSSQSVGGRKGPEEDMDMRHRRKKGAI